MRLSQGLFIVTAAFGLILLSACSPKVELRGNIPSPTAIDKLEVGKADMRQVADILGTPSALATFDNKTWYYIGVRREIYGYFSQELVDHQVWEVRFNDDGVLTALTKYDKDQLRTLQYSEVETPTAGREFTFWEQLFGNISRGAGPAPQ